MTEVIVQFARDASPFVILNPSQAIPKGAQLGLGLQPLRDVLIDANATNERVSDDQRHSVEIDVDLASVLSASERSGMNRLAVHHASAVFRGVRVLRNANELVGFLAHHFVF